MNLRYIDLDENLLTRGSDGTYYRLRIGQDDWIDSPRDWSPLGHMLCWNRRYNLGDKHDYSEPIDFWHDMVREHIDRNTLFAYALSGDGSVRLQKEIDEDGEESYKLCYWGYISFLGDKQKASWCIDKTYDTGDIEDLRSGGWYVEDDIIEDLGFEDCKRLLKDKVFYLPLYLYDHSGITMSTGSFCDSWDSGQVGFIYVTKEDIEKEYGAFNKKNLETAMSVLRGEVDIYNQYIHGDVYWYRLEKFLGGTVAGEEVSPQEALYADIFWEEIDSCGGFYGSDVTENGMTEHWPEMEEVA